MKNSSSLPAASKSAPSNFINYLWSFMPIIEDTEHKDQEEQLQEIRAILLEIKKTTQDSTELEQITIFQETCEKLLVAEQLTWEKIDALWSEIEKLSEYKELESKEHVQTPRCNPSSTSPLAVGFLLLLGASAAAAVLQSASGNPSLDYTCTLGSDGSTGCCKPTTSLGLENPLENSHNSLNYCTPKAKASVENSQNILGHCTSGSDKSTACCTPYKDGNPHTLYQKNRQDSSVFAEESVLRPKF